MLRRIRTLLHVPCSTTESDCVPLPVPQVTALHTNLSLAISYQNSVNTVFCLTTRDFDCTKGMILIWLVYCDLCTNGGLACDNKDTASVICHAQ